MRICGISFEAKAAVVAVVDKLENGVVVHVDTETKKISLDNHEDSDCLRGFQQTVRTFLADNSVDAVSIRRCSYGGKYPSGAASLKMEALLQVLDIKITLISGQTIKSKFQDGENEIPGSLRAYQHEAYQVAWVLTRLQGPCSGN